MICVKALAISTHTMAGRSPGQRQQRCLDAAKAGKGGTVGLILGAGTALMFLVFVLRLVPKAIGLLLWLGSAGATAAAAFLLLYLSQAGMP